MNNFYKCAKTKSNPIDTNEILEYNVSEVRQMMDYSKYPDGGRFYSGAERKKSIIINDFDKVCAICMSKG